MCALYGCCFETLPILKDMGIFDKHRPRKAEVLPPAREPELMFYDKAEMTFHDSVPLPEEQLGMARDTAAKQRGIVLDFFRRRFSMSFTPVNVHEALESDGSLILLTSVRRSITDLTKEGRLIKCQWSESKPGAYGKLNRTWRYNSEFINRLNPQK